MFDQSSQAHSLRSRRLWLPLLVLLLLAAAIRFAPLPHEALSGDEMFSQRMVVEPALQGWQDVREDLVHPPLYYMLLKGGTELWGASALGVRLLSLICGLVTLPVVFMVGNRLPGARWSGLLAAACVALGRYDLFYSQEARSYAMYTLLVLLLLLWMTYLQEPARSRGYWVLGGILMTLLVYTHYVGGVFVALAVFSVAIARVPVGLKLRVLGCGLVALVLFLPWLLGEVSVYREKHGIGSNLDWQGHPAFYDLRQVWAVGVGVNSFPGSTIVALLVLLILSVAGLVLLSRKKELLGTPSVLALACMGWLAPLIVFVLSKPPINLPLFALRHVLPATVLLAMLAAYGLELISRQVDGTRPTVMLAGSVVLLLLAAGPTIAVLHAGTSRYPYDQIGQAVLKDEQSGMPAYAVWYYGVGQPTNFYCARACVEKLPESDAMLPPRLVLLYRPASKTEVAVYRRMLAEGYVDDGHTYFTDGLGTQYGTVEVKLEKAGVRSGS